MQYRKLVQLITCIDGEVLLRMTSDFWRLVRSESKLLLGSGFIPRLLRRHITHGLYIYRLPKVMGIFPCHQNDSQLSVYHFELLEPYGLRLNMY